MNDGNEQWAIPAACCFLVVSWYSGMQILMLKTYQNPINHFFGVLPPLKTTAVDY